MTGYSLKFSRLVSKANEKISIGVTLGKFCIKKDIPVIQVANYFHVSRTAIYAWFIGKSIPNQTHQIKIHKFLKKKA